MKLTEVVNIRSMRVRWWETRSDERGTKKTGAGSWRRCWFHRRRLLLSAPSLWTAVDPLGSSTATATADCDVCKARDENSLHRVADIKKKKAVEDYQSEKKNRKEKKKGSRETLTATQKGNVQGKKGEKINKRKRTTRFVVLVLFENSMQIKSERVGWGNRERLCVCVWKDGRGRKQTIPPREYI